jgi:hypothetical protein
VCSLNDWSKLKVNKNSSKQSNSTQGTYVVTIAPNISYTLLLIHDQNVDPQMLEMSCSNES